jgi:hypothetical protein
LSGFEVEGGKTDLGESWGRKSRHFPSLEALAPGCAMDTLLLIKEQRGKAEETSMLGGLDKATKK